jgi:hypothetical protein
MDNKGMISLDPKLIDNLVKEHIYAAVAGSLADNKDVLIHSLLDTVLNLKVNANGEISQYSSDNKFSWLELTFNREMRGLIKKAIIEQIEALKPEVEKAVKKEMMKSGPAIAQAVMKGFSDSLKFDWNFNVGISGEKPQR